jgi:hypothetical protein
LPFVIALGTYFESPAKNGNFQKKKSSMVENNCKMKFGLLMCVFSFKNDEGGDQQPENVDNNQISGEENEYDVDDGGEEGIKEKEIKPKINTLNVSPSVGFSLQMNINPTPSSSSSSNNVIREPPKYGADQATQQYHCETDGSESDQSDEPVPRRSSMDQPTQYVVEEDDIEEEGDIFVIILLSKSITLLRQNCERLKLE